MSDSRTTATVGKHPGARFRCLVCQRFTTANSFGACPRCGFVAPSVTPMGELDQKVWRRVVAQARWSNRVRSRRVGLLILGLVFTAIALLVLAI